MSVALTRPELAEPAEAREPAEERGFGRDDVRLLVARGDGRLEHRRFGELPELLAPGDALVINTSATLPAAIPARTAEADLPARTATADLPARTAQADLPARAAAADLPARTATADVPARTATADLPARAAAADLRLHLSAPAGGDGTWLVELRRAGRRHRDARAGQVLLLPAGATAVLLEPEEGGRLWRAALRLPMPVLHYLARHGEPIRYPHAARDWPLERYQTVYTTEPGSAEMPSAGRAFTPELVTQLVAAGVDVAPLVLHTGVSSLEAGERPHAEAFRVPRSTAARVNLARELGGRVVAVGTTVVRALESAVGPDGRLRERDGWTDLVIEPDAPIRAIDGLLSGFHDRDSSHLAMLEAIGGRDLLERSYAEAAGAGYLRHEFGDLHLLLP